MYIKPAHPFSVTKQLSLELTLTLGWLLVIEPVLPLQADREAEVEAVVVLQAGVVVEV